MCICHPLSICSHDVGLAELVTRSWSDWSSTIVNLVKNLIEQHVELRPGQREKARVVSERGHDTLILDGKVDEFIAQDNSNIPIRSLADAKKLLNSQEIRDLVRASPNRWASKWMYHRFRPDSDRAVVLSVEEVRGNLRKINFGRQEIIPTANGVNIKTHVQVDPRGPLLTHTIYGGHDGKGNYQVMGEDYHVVKTSFCNPEGI